MQAKLFFQNQKKVNLCGILSNPTEDKSRPVIVLAHGFATNKNSFTNQALEHMLNNKGISTFRFDFFGHGESEGKFEAVTISEGTDDILSAVSFLKQRGYKKIGLIGSSFGGTCSILAASRLAKTGSLFVLALKSPVSDYFKLETGVRTKKDITDWKMKGFLVFNREKNLKLNYSFYEDILKLDIYKEAKKINIPTIIVHGDKDEEVSIAQSFRLVKIIETSKLIVVKNADHHYSDKKDFDTVMKLLSAFIEENVAIPEELQK